jgi:hypothetical protein
MQRDVVEHLDLGSPWIAAEVDQKADRQHYKERAFTPVKKKALISIALLESKKVIQFHETVYLHSSPAAHVLHPVSHQSTAKSFGRQVIQTEKNTWKPKHSLLTTSIENEKGICANLMHCSFGRLFGHTPISLPFLSNKPPEYRVYLKHYFISGHTVKRKKDNPHH